MSNLTSTADEVNHQSANEENRKQNVRMLDFESLCDTIKECMVSSDGTQIAVDNIIVDEKHEYPDSFDARSYDKVVAALEFMSELAKMRVELICSKTLTQGGEEVEAVHEIGDKIEMMRQDISIECGIVEAFNIRFKDLKVIENMIYWHLTLYLAGRQCDRQMIGMLDNARRSVVLLSNPILLCDGNLESRQIRCICNGVCKHVDMPYCPYCQIKDSTIFVCNGCGTNIEIGFTHCCQCHGNPRMCPICKEYHDGTECVNKFQERLPAQIVGDRAMLSRIGLQEYIKSTTVLAIRFANKNPKLLDKVGYYMRRICAMMPNSAFGPQDQGFGAEGLTAIAEFFGGVYMGVRDVVSSAISQALTEAVSVLLTNVYTSMKPAVAVAVVFLKTLIRQYIWEACPMMIVTEIIWDTSVITSLKALWSALSRLAKDAINIPQGKSIVLGAPNVDQAGIATGLVATALFYVASSVSGFDADKITSFLRVLPVFEKLIPDDLPKFLKTIPILSSFVGKDIDVHMSEKWPRTTNFREINMRAAAESWDELWQLVILQDAYYEFKQESIRFDDNARTYWGKFRGDLHIDKVMMKRLPTNREEPFSIYLYGLPGGGKTVSSTQILRMVYEWMLKEGLINVEATFDQSMFDVKSGSKYWGGFHNQKLIRLNDIMTKKTIPGDPQSDPFVIMGVIDSAPFEVPAAALRDKGIFLKALFVILTGNLSPEGVKANSNLNNKEALGRRFTYSFLVKPKHADKAGKMSVDPAAWDNIELWDRCVFVDEADNGREYSLLEVVELCVRGIHGKLTAPSVVSTMPEAWKIVGSRLPSMPGKFGKEAEKMKEEPVQNYKAVDHVFWEFFSSKDIDFKTIAERAGEVYASEYWGQDSDSIYQCRTLPNMGWHEWLLRGYVGGFINSSDYSLEAWSLLWAIVKVSDMSEENATSFMVQDKVQRFIISGDTGVLGEFEVLEFEAFVAEYKDTRDLHCSMLKLVEQMSFPIPDGEDFEHRSPSSSSGSSSFSGTGPVPTKYDEEYQDQPFNRWSTVTEGSIEDIIWRKRASAVYESIACTLTRIKMAAVDIVVKGTKITVEKANQMAALARCAFNFPERLRQVSLESVNKYLYEHLQSVNKDYVALIIGALVLMGVARSYKAPAKISEKIVHKFYAQDQSQPSRPEFTLGSIVASAGLLEKVDSSILGFSTDGMGKMGTVLAMSSTEFIVPTHMIEKCDDGFYLQSKKDNRQYNFQFAIANVRGGASFVSDPVRDLTVVRLGHGTVPLFAGNNYSKLCPVEVTGPGMCARLDWEPLNRQLYGYRTTEIVGHDNSRTKYCFPIESDSWVGLCGAAYVDSNSTKDSRIMAVHVSGHVVGDEGFAAPIDQSWYDRMTLQLNAWAHCKDPEEMEAVNRRDFWVDGTTIKRNTLPTVYKKHPMLSVQKECDKRGFKMMYSPAVLKEKGEDGLRPYQRASKKMLGRMYMKENIKQPDFKREELNRLFNMLGKGDEDLDYVESWEEVHQRINGHSPIDKSKSAGLGAGLKGNYFDADGMLNSDYISHLDEVVERMSLGDFKANRTGSTLKSELRPNEKVAAGSTRMFFNGDFDILMISKRYCEPLYRWLRKYAREYGMHFECTPDDSASMRAPKFGKIAFGCDIVNQDMSHMEWMYELIFEWALKMQVFQNDVNKPGIFYKRFGVHLEAKNVVRYGCFIQVMNTIFIVEDYLKRGRGALPSGDFLTFIINAFSDLFLYQLFKQKFSCMIDALGDDKIVTPDILNTMKSGKKRDQACEEFAEEIIKHWRLYGYELTSQIKGKPVFAQLHEDVTLCGRYLIKVGDGFKCPLQPERIMKSICYYNTVDPMEYNQTVMNFCFEMANQKRKTGRSMMECLVLSNGVKLLDYTGHFDMLMINICTKRTDLVARQIRDWMTIGPRKGRKGPRTLRSKDEVFFSKGVDHGDESSVGKSLVATEIPSSDSMKYTKHNLWTETVAPRGVEYMVLNREVVIRSDEISNSDTPGTVLFREMLPTILFDNNPRMLAELENTAYFLFEAVVVRFSFNVSGFHSGGVIITAAPGGRTIGSVDSACSGPNIIVNFQKNNREAVDMKRRIDVELVVPFNRDLFAIPSIGYTVPEILMNYARVTMLVMEMGNASTQGPIPYVVKARFINPRVIESSSSWIPAPMAKARNHGKEQAEIVVGGPVNTTSVSGPTGTQDSTIYNFPFSNVGNGNNIAVEEVDVSVGACKPIIPPQLAYYKSGIGFGVANCNGGDGSIVLGSGMDSRGIMPPMENTVDQMSFAHMSRQNYLVNRAVWRNTDIPKTRLWSGLAGPWSGPGQGMAGYFPLIASMFMWWRADMVFHFEAFPNALMTGTYMVVVDYRVYGPTNLNYEDSNNMYRVYVDLEEGCSVTVRVPYVSVTPWLLASDQFMPRLTLFSVTSLGVNTAGADNVPIRIFAHAENAMFMWPFYNQIDPPVPATRRFLEREKPRKEDKKDKGKEKAQDQGCENESGDFKMVVPYATSVVLGPSSTRYKDISPEDYMLRFGDGESITDLRSFLKRFHFIGTVSPAANNQITFIHDPGVLTSFPEWYVELSRAFVYQYGGVRYKLYPEQATVSTFAATWSRSGLNELEPQAFCATGGASVVEVQINPCGRFPYRVIAQDDVGMPQFLSTRSLTATSRLLFAVSESFEWFGGNYLGSQTFMPDAGIWFIQEPDTYSN